MPRRRLRAPPPSQPACDGVQPQRGAGKGPGRRAPSRPPAVVGPARAGAGRRPAAPAGQQARLPGRKVAHGRRRGAGVQVRGACRQAHHPPGLGGLLVLTHSAACRRAGAGDTVQAAYRQALAAAAAGGGFEAVVRGAAAALGPDHALRLHGLAFPRPPAAAGATSGDEAAAAECHALHTVVRARHASGAEGFALLLPLDAGAAPEAAALAAALGVAAARHLGTSGWLAKDVAVVFLDAACGLAPSAQVRWTRCCVEIRGLTPRAAHAMPISMLPNEDPLTQPHAPPRRRGWGRTTARRRPRRGPPSPGRGCCSRRLAWRSRPRRPPRPGSRCTAAAGACPTSTCTPCCGGASRYLSPACPSG